MHKKSKFKYFSKYDPNKAKSFWVTCKLYFLNKLNIYHAGFELNFQSCIAKNYCKISLVSVSPKCPPCLHLRDKKCQNFASSNVNYGKSSQSHITIRLKNKKCFLKVKSKQSKKNKFKNLTQTIKITWTKL